MFNEKERLIQKVTEYITDIYLTFSKPANSVTVPWSLAMGPG